MGACWPKNAYWIEAHLEWERDVHTKQIQIQNESTLADLRILFEWIESIKPLYELFSKDNSDNGK